MPQQSLTLQSKWTVQYMHLQSMFVCHLHNQRKNEIQYHFSNIILFLSLPTSSVPPPPASGPHIPSAQTAFGFRLGALPPTPHNGVLHVGPGYPLPPLPPPGPFLVPLPPPLPPPAAHTHLAGYNEDSRAEAKPVKDARSDLLSAIRMGK